MNRWRPEEFWEVKTLWCGDGECVSPCFCCLLIPQDLHHQEGAPWKLDTPALCPCGPSLVAKPPHWGWGTPITEGLCLWQGKGCVGTCTFH